MKKLFPAILLVIAACSGNPPVQQSNWNTDFFDDFDTFNTDNWQDQRLWVNHEYQCYVPDNRYGTREVSDGAIKMKVVNIGKEIECDNYDKQGNKHFKTKYVAGRIASKNRKEFVKGKWTARLRVRNSGQKGMFPAWWLLGARNNEPPVQEANENICWPVTGSGEIDIFEHHSDGGPDHYALRAIMSEGKCGDGDWLTPQKVIDAKLDEYHEYSTEWQGKDIIYRLDGKEVHRNVNQGDDFPEALFAILNFAKINDAPMEGEWVMEVDWVKHESRLINVQ
ncbi:MAG: family 16 glycosylhydrolase [Gammaproteobacteria bacterium]|nr:family 16 glycosylhydrolase [Gammaproteobacteria bacterium]